MATTYTMILNHDIAGVGTAGTSVPITRHAEGGDLYCDECDTVNTVWFYDAEGASVGLCYEHDGVIFATV